MQKQLRSYFKTISTLFNRYMLWIPLAAVLVLASATIWYQLSLRPVDREHSQTFRVETGDSARAISRRLYDQGFIRNSQAFEIYITIHGQRRRLQAGVYSPPAHASAKQIANMLATGQVNAKRLTVPEGFTLAKIKDAAAKQGIAATDLDAALSAYRSSGKSAVMAAIPAGVSMEGYMFPDTYTISGDQPAADLVAAMATNLEANLAKVEDGLKAQGLTLHQGLTLASMVEKEVSIEADRPVVAQVFLKRWREGMRLESDPTADYAASLLGIPSSISIQSPYNTYRSDGLPPGPICSPGLSALKAVANPATSDYLYFLSGRDGKTYFAHTFEEHQQNIAKYLR